MRQGLYDRIVAYIVESQEGFYRLAYSYVRNQEDALNIVQNTVCKTSEYYEISKNEDAVRTQFYRIVANESMASLEKDRWEVSMEDRFAAKIPYYETGYGAKGGIYEEMNRMKLDVQNIMKLRFYGELSLEEVVEIT